jgi:hypothetical protein
MSGDDLERALHALNRRRPFRSFFLEFNSADRILISHPEAIDRQGELFIYRGPDGSHRVFSGASICQFIDPPPAAPGS